ncbi:MAG: ParB/RepB/Spo0J family partition protein, partial [Methanomassiliicoccales archaeon]
SNHLIPIKAITFRSEQPRKKFESAALDELTASIKEHGVLQPILVRPHKNGYEVVAGERRLRAASKAGLRDIPAIIREIDDNQAAEIALVENLQREDLSPIEEAMAYRQLIDKYAYTQETVAEKIGRSRAYVANMVRLLALPAEIVALLERGELSVGHARALLALPIDQETLIKLAKLAVEKGYNVRQMEQLAREQGSKRKTSVNLTREYFLLEQKLQDALGTKARIVKSKNGGRIEIMYYSDEDLDRLVELFKIEM